MTSIERMFLTIPNMREEHLFDDDVMKLREILLDSRFKFRSGCVDERQSNLCESWSIAGGTRENY